MQADATRQYTRKSVSKSAPLMRRGVKFQRKLFRSGITIFLDLSPDLSEGLDSAVLSSFEVSKAPASTVANASNLQRVQRVQSKNFGQMRQSVFEVSKDSNKPSSLRPVGVCEFQREGPEGGSECAPAMSPNVALRRTRFVQKVSKTLHCPTSSRGLPRSKQSQATAFWPFALLIARARTTSYKASCVKSFPVG